MRLIPDRWFTTRDDEDHKELKELEFLDHTGLCITLVMVSSIEIPRQHIGFHLMLHEISNLTGYQLTTKNVEHWLPRHLLLTADSWHHLHLLRSAEKTDRNPDQVAIERMFAKKACEDYQWWC